MKNKDYWNVKEAKKIKFKESFLFFIFFCTTLLFTLYLMRSEFFLIFIVVLGGIIWYIYDFYKIQSRIISFPVVRMQDELLIYDYDQKIVSLDHIYKITWIMSKNRIVISYRIPSKSNSGFLKSTHERFDYIDVKWIENKKNFIQELQNMCEGKEIPFIVVNKQPWYHILIIY